MNRYIYAEENNYSRLIPPDIKLAQAVSRKGQELKLNNGVTLYNYDSDADGFYDKKKNHVWKMVYESEHPYNPKTDSHRGEMVGWINESLFVEDMPAKTISTEFTEFKNSINACSLVGVYNPKKRLGFFVFKSEDKIFVEVEIKENENEEDGIDEWFILNESNKEIFFDMVAKWLKTGGYFEKIEGGGDLPLHPRIIEWIPTSQ